MRVLGRLLPISVLVLVNAVGCVVEPSASSISVANLEEAAARASSPSPLVGGGGTECPPGMVETLVCDEGSALVGRERASIVADPCHTECVPEPSACGDAPSTGATVHSVHFGSVGDEQQFAVAVDAAGNSIYAGTSWNSVIGGNTLLIRALDPRGMLLWSISKPVGIQSRAAIALTSDGGIVVSGWFGTFKFDSAGNDLWSRLPISGSLRNSSLAADAAGNIFFATTFYNTLDIGGGPLTSAGGVDIFVAKLDSAGNVLWNKRFGATKDQNVEGIAVDSAGNLVLTGFFKGSLDFGGGALVGNGTAADAFVAKLGPNGAHQWSRRFGDTADQVALTVAVDSADNIIFGGAQAGSVNYGGGALTSVSGYDALLVKLTKTGQHVWSKIFGGAWTQYTRALAVDPCDNILMVDWNSGNGEGYSYPSDRGVIDLGGGPLWTNLSGLDVVVAKLDPSGGHLYSRIFGGEANEMSYSIAAAPDGQAVVAYDLNSDPVDFGLGPMSSQGFFDQVLLRFTP